MSKETITSETYQKALNAHSEEWGKAYLTGFEQELLFEEHRQFMQRYSIDSNSAWYLLKDHLNRGNFPQFESVSSAQFIEAAISHGCPVALSLYEERSDPALITRSYLTKNRAYRMIKRVLRENNNPLLSQWIGAEIKAYKHDGVACYFQWPGTFGDAHVDLSRMLDHFYPLLDYDALPDISMRVMYEEIMPEIINEWPHQILIDQLRAEEEEQKKVVKKKRKLVTTGKTQLRPSFLRLVPKS